MASQGIALQCKASHGKANIRVKFISKVSLASLFLDSTVVHRMARQSRA